MEYSKLSNRKILVTGASGFIGAHLCQRLNEIGAEVHGISRNIDSDTIIGVHKWQGDLADFAVTRNLLIKIKPDIIFHLASHVAGKRDAELVLSTFQSNLASTVNLLSASTEIQCHRIVSVGSMEEPEQSDTNAIPCSPYAAAKWASSGYVRMFHALYNTPVVIARVFMVYGPGQGDYSKLVPNTILSLLRQEPPKLTSGNRQVDWIYVTDVVEGLIKMAYAEGIEGCTIDLGTGVLVTIKNLVQQLVSIMATNVQPIFGFLPERPLEQVRIANVERTHTQIGWKPTTSLKKGLQCTIDWYKRLEKS
jgi:nucleoside-diphosphate-sugar epimerase